MDYHGLAYGLYYLNYCSPSNGSSALTTKEPKYLVNLTRVTADSACLASLRGLRLSRQPLANSACLARVLTDSIGRGLHWSRQSPRALRLTQLALFSAQPSILAVYLKAQPSTP